MLKHLISFISNSTISFDLVAKQQQHYNSVWNNLWHPFSPLWEAFQIIQHNFVICSESFQYSSLHFLIATPCIPFTVLHKTHHQNKGYNVKHRSHLVSHIPLLFGRHYFHVEKTNNVDVHVALMRSTLFSCEEEECLVMKVVYVPPRSFRNPFYCLLCIFHIFFL